MGVLPTLSGSRNNGGQRRGQNADIAAIAGTYSEKMMTKQSQQAHRQPVLAPRTAKPAGPIQTRTHHTPKPAGSKPPATRPQGPKPQPLRPQELKPNLRRDAAIPLNSPQRPATKTPITKEDVKRIQRATALDNDGHQADWTKNLQSIADKREARAPHAPKPRGAGQGGGNDLGSKKKA